MRRRFSVPPGALIVASTVLTLASAAYLTGQTPRPTGAGPTIPRTADGKPDLQGVWDFRTLTPLERPKELAGKQVLTDEEAADFERRRQQEQDKDNREATARGNINGAPTTADVERAYNDFWWDYGKKLGTKRSSLITDPPDGRIPALTKDGQERAAARRVARERPAVGPEDRGVGERCILGFNSEPLFEYACHEGNYGMTNLLSAARAVEAAGARKGSR